jgi:hypothetical protein
MLLGHYRVPINLRLNRAALQHLLAFNFFAMSVHLNRELPNWAGTKWCIVAQQNGRTDPFVGST